MAGPLLAARADANPFVEWGGRDAELRAAKGARVGGRVQRHGDLLQLHASTSARARGGGDPLPATPISSELAWFWRASPRLELPNNLGALELVADARGPLDLDQLPEPLTVRWRGGGERLSPRRGGPRRALKNLLQEARVPVTERARLPLLFSVTPEEVKLLAVADLLLDERVQATAAARHRARFRWKKSSHSH
jgi:tRNA(Ile)-lysidine synthetase-like protein